MPNTSTIRKEILDNYPANLFNAVYDKLTLEGADPAEARILADQAVDAYKNKRDYDLTVEHRKTVQMIGRFFAKIGRTLLIVGILAGIAFGIYYPVSHVGRHDYAGYGPSKVGKHIRAAMTYQLTQDMLYTEPHKVQYNDHPAWRSTVWFNDNPNKYCVYVWKQDTNVPGFVDLDGYHIDNGACQ